MKPIINPWIIYFAELSEGIKVTLTCVVIVLTVIFAVFSYIAWDNAYSEKKEKAAKTKFKKIAILIVIIGILSVGIPTKQTVYSMVLLDNITPQNIENFKGETKELVDYIVDKMGELKNGNQD